MNLEILQKEIKILQKEIKMIQDVSIREFTIACLKAAPSYFWEVASSSTGKYHPVQSNGIGGLIRHTRAVVYFANKLCEVYDVSHEYKDCIISACLLHDIVKYGEPKGLYTTKTHDFDGARFVENIAKTCTISSLLLSDIVDGIEWHMGRWTKRADKVRKFPSEYSMIAEIVHLADVISSQKAISLDFLDESSEVDAGIKDGTLQMPFGKHKGLSFEEIPSDYLRWMRDNIDDTKLKTAAINELSFRDTHNTHR